MTDFKEDLLVYGESEFLSKSIINSKGITSPYALSVQQTGNFGYIEILTDSANSGFNKGAFFGIEDNGPALTDQHFTLYNWQGGPILFYTATTASAGTVSLTIGNDGVISFDKYTAGVLKTNGAGVITSGTINKSDISDFVEGDYVHTFGNENVAGVKTFTDDVPIVIDSSLVGANLEIGYFDGTTLDCYGVRRSDLSGLFCLMPNSDNPQIFLGNENNTTGQAFIDVDNNRPLNLNTLDTGAGTPAVVNIGSGGLNINAGGNITLGATNTVDGVDLGSPINSIEVSSNAYQLVGDSASPGNTFYYGTNGAGAKGYYDLDATVTTILGVTSIDELSDVDTTTTAPFLGNFLYWDGSNFIPTESTTFRFTVSDGTCAANFIDTTGLDFCNTQIGPAAGSAFYIGQRALGTIAAPTAVSSGLKLAGYSAAGYDGTDYYVGAEMSSYANEAFNGTDGGTRTEFLTTPNGTQAAVVRLNIEADGTLNTGDTVDYELLVTADDDIPNKLYADRRQWDWSVARNAANQGNQLLRRQNGTPTNLTPYIAYVDATIDAISAGHDPNDATNPDWDFQVLVNGVVVLTLFVDGSVDHKAFDATVSVNVSAGDEITMQMANQTAVVDYPAGSIHLTERYS